MSVANPGASMARAIASGALVVAPLASWLLFRTLPFNSLDPGTRVSLGLFYLAAYALAGAGLGAAMGFVALVARRLGRGWWIAIPLASVMGFWLAKARFVSPGGPWAWGIGVALGVGLVGLILSRLGRNRGGQMALGVAGLQIAVFAFVVSTDRSAAAPRQADLPDRLAALTMQEPTVVVLALDGVEEEIFHTLLKAGELPHLERLQARSAHGRLETLEPTWSPPIWTTMWTGKLPAEHGITYFVARGAVRFGGHNVVIPRLLGGQRIATAVLPGVAVPVNQRQRRATAVWEAVGLAGHESVLANRILSWPVLPMRGVDLSERLVRLERAGDDEAYPAEMADLVRERLSQVAPLDDPRLSPVPWLSNTLAREGELWRIATDEAVAREARLLILYTHMIDSAQHRFLKYHWPDRFRFTPDPRSLETFEGVIAATYRAVDQMVGEVMARVGAEARVLVISDHGVRPNLTLKEDRGEPVGATRMPQTEGADVSGVHGDAPDGVFLLSGPGITPGRLSFKPHVLQIAPLILDLLGLPAAEDMERRSVLESHPELLTLTRPPAVSSYEGWIPRRPGIVGSASDEAILEELRALGYID